ncbi:hypothetical protein Salat_0199100 [Sesamum alatum]|uniref:Uncharacterized protein n=1 Tax=Sesamum alatum TaxID=300844 RepID=A0AAE1YZL5_9LAMI|nr:hypothetical protein Salat_0199100 [Sesamum alatum]
MFGVPAVQRGVLGFSERGAQIFGSFPGGAGWRGFAAASGDSSVAARRTIMEGHVSQGQLADAYGTNGGLRFHQFRDESSNSFGLEFGPYLELGHRCGRLVVDGMLGHFPTEPTAGLSDVCGL